MCGIAGIFDFNRAPVDRQRLETMTSVIAHRGPDGAGVFLGQGIGLGHRRLSIIDLEGGAQPLANENGSLQVVFNGEIYNYVELRAELIANGHRFRTASDTEVIVHGYEEWGRECVAHFNGMFAFALWDGNRRVLFLARDHLGIKPLYYTRIGNAMYFASEIKSLLTHPECERRIDVDALAQLFTLRYVPSPKTLFSGIRKLPPAHSAIISETGIKLERYWNQPPRVRCGRSEGELVEEYRGLLQDTVRLQMRSDVPVGLFLSSGIDSGVLLALMSEHTHAPVHTFTIGFEGGERTNEISAARALATHYGSDHSEMVIGPADYRQYYERYLWDLEEPVGNESAVASYFLSMLARRKVKVALTGQGADEPWAGYDRHRGARFSTAYAGLPHVVTAGIIRPLVERFSKSEKLRRAVVSLDEPDLLSRFVKIYSFYSEDMKQQLFQPWLREQVSADGVEAKRALRSLHAEVASLDPLTQILYLDTRTNLPDDLLMVGDKTSMAHSLEARVPLLDYRIVEFVESLQPAMRLHGLCAKYLHKKAVEKWLPKDVVYRRKNGFANPVDQWLRSSMAKYVQDCLLTESSASNRYFNPAYIRRLLVDHAAGEQNYMRQIYLLISFELWHQRFLN
ncbi:MAG: asparagine synthase (glutamine-hydrolyzing) [Acidobacteria bacterium]|nr:MAG: asparagine synthase (glutamine-hydrolyzing) [Acidobacteriota bacterium]